MTFLDRIKETSTSTGTGTFTLGGAVLGYKVFTNGTYKYCIVNETESEWEVGEGTVASGVLTRTTIEASSNGGAAVSFSAGTKYVFNTVSAAYVNSLVPYTGATAAVNLGVYGITSDYLQLSTSPTASGAVGRMLWNDQIGSTETTLKGGSVVLKNGVDLVARVVNKVSPAATLTKATYKAVRVSGAQGQRLAIAYAQANTDNNSADTIGLVCETIAQNQEGFIITVGQLTGINTTGSLQGETWADGDVLYLSPTTAGNLTNIKPTGATGHIVVIGYVEYAHAINGSIYVKIMNGWELDELHNVYINAVANNDVLVYESSSTLWKNKSIATILGYTPQVQLNGTGFVKATGTTISYDNTTYAADSLVVHLAGAETITGVKTFQNALQTTAGNNLLNTGGGNTVIGYTADPASSATYKLDVNGYSQTKGMLVNSTATREFQVLDQYGVNAFKVGLNGQFATIGGYALGGMRYLDFVHNQTAANVYIRAFNDDAKTTQYGQFGMFTNRFIIQPTSTDLSNQSASIFTGTSGFIGYFTYDTTPASAAFAIKSTTKGFLLPQMTTTEKNAISTPATSLLVYDTTLAAFQYYTGSAWAGLGGITGSGTAGQVTYWSGTSAVTGSSNLFWDNTNGRLGIGTSSPTQILDIRGSLNSSTGIDVTNSSSGNSARSLIRLYNNNGSLAQLSIFGGGTAASYANKTFFEASKDFVIGTDAAIASGGTSKFQIYLGGYNAATSPQFTVNYNGNLLLNTTSDGGQRLQVIGSMRVGTTAASAMYWDDTNNRLGIGTSSPTSSLHIVGAGNTSATTALTVQNSDGTNLFRVRNEGRLFLGSSSTSIYPMDKSTTSISLSGNGLSFFDTSATSGDVFYFTGSDYTHTSGLARLFNATRLFWPTSGTGSLVMFNISPNINQTGGANGITRGLYINPTLTSAADFRAIETTNGKIVFGNLPTSSAGLPTGALWNNLGIVSIV